jgi:hypothetical protein
MASTDEVFQRLRRIRAAIGLRAALAYLGVWTGYRCVALIRLLGTELEAIAYFDRERPDRRAPEAWADAVRAACLVRDDDGCIRAASERLALRSDDTDGVACRCVPVLDADGELQASLCVFEEGQGMADAIDTELLVRAAASLGAPIAEAPSAWRSTSSSQSAAGEEDPGSALDV